MQCTTCGDSLVFDMVDEELIEWCPKCGKAYETDETECETGIPGVERKHKPHQVARVGRNKV